MQTRQRVLESIKRLTRPSGPTVREIAAELGLSVASVHHHLGGLRDEGKITWEERKARSIRLVE